MVGVDVEEKSIYSPPDELLIEVVGQTITFAQFHWLYILYTQSNNNKWNPLMIGKYILSDDS